MINENWAYFAAILNLLGTTTYVVAVFRGTARPNRVTWGVLSLAPIIAFASMLSQGIGLSQSVVTLSVGLSPLMIFISTFLVKHPAWKIKPFDIGCGALSVLGLVLWQITGEGNLAIIFSILADGLAFLPTLVKAYNHPETESPWAFIISQFATVIALLAITTYDFTHVAFQAYIFTSNLFAILFIYFKFGVRMRHILGKPPIEPV